MAYATASDVAIELGRPATSPGESDQWEAWIARVERSVVRGFRRSGYELDAQVALGEPTADEIQDVEVAAVIRKIQNPTWGEDSTTKTIDDGSITRRRTRDAQGDPLDLLVSEWDSLLPGSGGDAFSTRPGFEVDRAPIDTWSELG
jgi:hypothetical protein